MSKKNEQKSIDFAKFWSVGLNDHEIAKKIGVDINTVRTVKKDLSSFDTHPRSSNKR